MVSSGQSKDKINQVVTELKSFLGKKLSTSKSVREQHGGDEGFHRRHPPAAVAFVTTTDEVSAIIRTCSSYGCPVVPFGTGTGLEGGTAALLGGICINLGGMNNVLEVNLEDLDCRVQAGVTRKQLDRYLHDTGLFFPIDPGADASLGGMVATRASGTNAVLYGTMRENVLGLTVVLPDGRVIKTGGRARKSAAGYDLTHLFVGSEGTLGVITEVQLRLYGLPEAMSAAVCQFENLDDAVNSVICTIQCGIPVARIELLDEVQMGACIRYSNLKGYKIKPTLMFEFHGTVTSVKEQAASVGTIISEFGASAFRWAVHSEDRNKLWKARHDAYYAALSLQPGKKGLATDVCVPIARLADCISETKRDINESGLVAPIVGHVGDGNFHLLLLVDPEDQKEMISVNALNERLVNRALAMGGTSTGEHGIGFGKVEFLRAEHGEAVSVMRIIKDAIDPSSIMNPGKIFSK